MLRVITRFIGFAGSPWIHVSYWTGADTGAGATAANTAIGAFWGAVDNFMSTAASWSTDPIVAVMDPATGNRTGNFTVTPATGAGSVATDVLPPATQALIRLRTGVFINSREVRGRINVPGLCEVNSLSGRPDATLVTALNTAASTLNAATTPDLAVWSRQNHTATAVVATDTWSEFAIRRSRRDPG